MRHEALWIAPCLLLAACDTHPDPSAAADEDNGVHVASDGTHGVSVSVPGLDARLELPGMDLSRHVDLDGIKLAPGTRVRTMDVGDRQGTGGTVVLSFSAPQPPAVLIAYYRQATGRVGFGIGRATATTLAADKGERHFTLSAHPEGPGSAGTLRIAGE